MQRRRNEKSRVKVLERIKEENRQKVLDSCKGLRSCKRCKVPLTENNCRSTNTLFCTNCELTEIRFSLGSVKL